MIGIRRHTFRMVMWRWLCEEELSPLLIGTGLWTVDTLKMPWRSKKKGEDLVCGISVRFSPDPTDQHCRLLSRRNRYLNRRAQLNLAPRYLERNVFEIAFLKHEINRQLLLHLA